MNFSKDTPFEEFPSAKAVPPEAKVVVSGLRALHGKHPDAFRRSCTGCRDWNAVLDFADSHRVVPAFREALRKHAANLIPAEPMRALDARFRTNAQQNLILATELLRLTKLFVEKELTVFPFKGPVLAVQAFDDLTMRQSGDLDFFVAPDEAWQAAKLLLDEGYTSDPPLHHVHFSRSHMRGRRELNFMRKWGHAEIHVELKWRAGEFHMPWSFDTSKTEHVNIAGGTVRTFSHAETFFYLCHHGSRHMWQRLSWIQDIASLLAMSGDALWRLMLRESTERGCRRNLLIASTLAQQLCGSELPEPVSKAVRRDSVALNSARKLVPWILSSDQKPLFKHYHSFHVRSRERLRDRVTIWGAWLWDTARMDRVVALKK